MRIKLLFGFLLLLVSLGAHGAGRISEMIQTNNVPTLTLLELSVPTVSLTNVTRSITVSNLMATFKNLGFTNGLATLQTVNNASNILVTYVNTTTNGFATLQTVNTASNVLFALIGEGGGGATNAINNLNGKGTNTAIYATSETETNLVLIGAYQQKLISAQHSNEVFGVYTTSGGDGELVIRDDLGDIMVRLRAGSGNSYLGGAGGNVGIGQTAPTATFHVLSDGEPSAIIESTVNDIDHLRVIADGQTMLVLDSAGGFGRYQALSNGTPKVVISSGGNSYFIGGKIGIGTVTPAHMLDVTNGAARFGNITPGRLVISSTDGTLTNGLYTPANIASNFVNDYSVSNRIFGAFTTNTIATNGVIDLSIHKQTIFVTNNSTFGFSNTNDGNSAIVTFENPGGFGLVLNGVVWDGSAPSTPWSGTNHFSFWVERSSTLYGGFSAAELGSESFMATLGALGTNSTFRGTLTIDQATAEDYFLRSDGSGGATWAPLPSGAGEANTLTSAGAIGLVNPKVGVGLFVKGGVSTQIATNSSTFYIKNGAELTNIISYDDFYAPIRARAGDFELAQTSGRFSWTSGPKFAYVDTSTIALSNSANTAIGTLIANVTGTTLGFASGPKFVNESGTLGTSNSANTARAPINSGLLTAQAITVSSNITSRLATGAAIASTGTTNWLVDFTDSDVYVPVTAHTNWMFMIHGTNRPASGFTRASRWIIETGNTNLHFCVPSAWAANMAGTNTATTSVLLTSNAHHFVTFKVLGDSESLTFLNYPVSTP